VNSIYVADVEIGSTVEIILHHNFPLEIIKNKNGLSWEISQNKSGAKAKFVTHFTGRLTTNNASTHTVQVWGGPYAGQGLGRDIGGQGMNYTATATIPWNYIARMYVLSQKEIPTISNSYGRMNIIKTAVRF
tara:strand:- start:177 stop:572 length:396 start_codon:yes stop_codon:yes gene_type:complete